MDVENVIMYHIPKLTTFKVGDVLICGKEKNGKYKKYLEIKNKKIKTKKDLLEIKKEDELEEIRLLIDKTLPCRFTCLYVSDKINDSEILLKKWAQWGIKPRQVLKLSLTGKLQKCSCFSDEEKEKAFEEGIEKEYMMHYWKGDIDTGDYEYLFSGKATVVEVVKIL